MQTQNNNEVMQGRMMAQNDIASGIEQKNQLLIAIEKQKEMRNLDMMPADLRRYMQMSNIAEELSKEDLQDIASMVIDTTYNDESSRSEWLDVIERLEKLTGWKLEPKSYPFENSANIKFPMIISSCIQFNSRTMPEIIKNDKVVVVRDMSPDDPQHTKCKRADDMSAHMSYQLLGQSDHWVSDTDKLLIMLPLMGMVFRKSFYNSIIKQPDTELISAKDIIINNNAKSLESAQRVTHKFTMSANEIIENMKAGLFINYPIDELMTMGKSDEQKTTFTTDKDLKNKLYEQDYEVYEQHRYLDLDGDGYQEPYIVTVLKESQKVLRIVARYNENSFEYNAKGEVIKIKPIHYFTDFGFIPDPNGGYYCLGFGTLLFDLNETTNSITNQLIDAGTLANMQGGFISRNLRLPKGDLRFKPGEYKQVNTMPGTSIADNIFMMPIKEPSQVLFTLLNFIIESSRAITAVSQVMQGDLPPPTTPAATTMALIEQGQKIYSSILYRIYNSLKKEFLKLYEINKRYMQQEEQFLLAIGSGIIKIDDYKMPNYGIFPVADPQLSSSMQRLMQAQALMQLMGMPGINNYEVLRNYLEALKIPNINDVLPPPDPQKPPSIQELMAEAELKDKNMDIACKLMDRELKAIGLTIEENKQKSQSAYYGGQLATQKISAITDLTEANALYGDQQVKKAATEEEVLTKTTQEDQQPDLSAYSQLKNLNSQLTQMIGGLDDNVKQDNGIDQQQQQQQGLGNVPQLTPEQMASISGENNEIII